MSIGSSAASPGLERVRQPSSRADLVCDSLRRAILEGRLQPGQPLVERELAALLGVSKTPIREALRQLHTTGLVEINAYQGVSVRTLDEASVHQLYSARAVAEPAALRLAVEQGRHTPGGEARRALNEATQHLGAVDIAELGMANRRFHRELYRPCDNSFLSGFLDQLQDITTFVAISGWRVHASFHQEADEHAAILAAAEQGDAKTAARLNREHILGALQTLQASLNKPADSPPDANPSSHNRSEPVPKPWSGDGW